MAGEKEQKVNRFLKRTAHAMLAEWFRRCKRPGHYEQGKLLYEKGGLNIDNLTEDALVDVEEDYPCLCPYTGQCW